MSSKHNFADLNFLDMDRTLVVFISPHGNGHAVRVCDALRELCRGSAPRIVVVSTQPRSFLRSRLGDIAWHQVEDAFDPGMCQTDSVKTDLDASLKKVLEFSRVREQRIEDAVRLLRDLRADAVFSDIPGVPLRAARELGIPAIAMGNFSWNWIFEQLAAYDPRWLEPARAFREDYAAADLLLRLPFHEPMDAFQRIVDIGLLASPGQPRRSELADRTGAPILATWVLLSFTSLDLSSAAVARMSELAGFCFFTVRPLEWSAPRFYAVSREMFPFADVLASCDVVLTKTGFGIVSECIVNDRPIVFVHRPEWPESALLVGGIRRYVRHAELSAEALYAGEVQPALETALRCEPPKATLPRDGARRAAQWLAWALRGQPEWRTWQESNLQPPDP